MTYPVARSAALPSPEERTGTAASREEEVLAGIHPLDMRLGAGGMGDAHGAEITVIGRGVAIKILRAELLQRDCATPTRGDVWSVGVMLSVPDELAKITVRCLETDPARRFTEPIAPRRSERAAPAATTDPGRPAPRGRR